MKSSSMNYSSKRLVVLFIVFLTLFSGLLLRTAYIQLVPDSRLQNLSRKQYETVVRLQPRRGDVLDRNRKELAVSRTVFSLFVDPQAVRNKAEVASVVSSETPLTKQAVLAKIKDRSKRFVWLSRGLDRVRRDRIVEKHVHGLGFIEESERIYPNEQLMSNILGLVGADGSGLEGLELQYNSNLSADETRMNLQRDARGRPLLINGRLFESGLEGAELQTTIDRDLQFRLEDELKSTVIENDADSAVGIVLDAESSEVLAMATSFNPVRDPGGFKRNRVVTDAFEPGSTLKAIVMAAALEKKIIEPNTKFDCEGGKMRIGNRWIHEADEKHVYNNLTTTEILAYSSNIGVAKVAMKLGAPTLREFLVGFGFGEKLGIDFPGEAKGLLQALPWREHLLANVSFGHGVSGTALQVANAYAAIANEGWLKRPYLVKSILTAQGKLTTKSPQTIRRVISGETAKKLKLMLMNATADDATGKAARVPGFPVAGKTGTAQKVNPNGLGYVPGAYISSFAGFLPVHQPKFVIYVAVDSPRKNYYGSAVAAPVFAKVAKFAVRNSGMAPVVIAAENLSASRKQAFKVITSKAQVELASGAKVDAYDGQSVPDWRGLSLREVLQKAQGYGIDLRVSGSGIVQTLNPAPGSKLPDSKQVSVYLSNE